MRTLWSLVMVPLALPGLASPVLAGGSCPAGGCPSAGAALPAQPGAFGHFDPCVPNPFDFITPFPDPVRIFPAYGYTAYPPRGVDCRGDFTPYRQVDWMTPPSDTAQIVLQRLHNLGVPLVTPEPEFLGKNPRAEPATLPTPSTEETKPDEKGEKGEKGEKKDKGERTEPEKGEKKEKLDSSPTELPK